MIGVFDSGFGGLGVLKYLRRELPAQDFVYLGDSGRAPYGGRDVDALLDLAEQAVEHLFDLDCSLIVVACNTLSCVALRHLQRRYCAPGAPRRILGVTIPGAELVARTCPRSVLLLATRRTVDSGTYPAEIAKLRPDLQVYSRATPLLAPLVEEGWANTPIAREILGRYLVDVPPVDAILLGCTHYPLLAEDLRALVPDLPLLDPAPELARSLARWLVRHPEVPVAPGTGKLRVICTGDPVFFQQQGSLFLGEVIPRVDSVSERKGRLVPGLAVADRRGQVVRGPWSHPA